MNFRTIGFIVVVAFAWMTAFGYEAWSLHRYEITPGPGGTAPREWPAASAITRVGGGPMVLMVIHPQCSCTEASLEELTAALAEMPADTAVWLIVEDLASDAREGPTGARFKRLLAEDSRVRLMEDVDGREARRFGAMTSGDVIAYDNSGNLTFVGGITASRGHVGDNFGRSLLIESLRRAGLGVAQHSVYGCEL